MGLIALFDNARQVIKVDSMLDPTLDVQVRPVPEQYSSECGMCISFSEDIRAEIETIAHQLGFSPRIYEF